MGAFLMQLQGTLDVPSLNGATPEMGIGLGVAIFVTVGLWALYQRLTSDEEA